MVQSGDRNTCFNHYLAYYSLSSTIRCYTLAFTYIHTSMVYDDFIMVEVRVYIYYVVRSVFQVIVILLIRECQWLNGVHVENCAGAHFM